MIRATQEGATAEIVLDRPEAGNALNRDGVDALRDALDRADGDGAEVLLLRGAGESAFCGGMDSREMVASTPALRRAGLRAFADCCLALWAHPALTVAALDGYAIGGGAHLAMACDLRAVAPGASLQFPAGRYGLNLTAVWLTLAAGPATALRLLSGAPRIDAVEACSLGLASPVTSAEDALAELGMADASGLRATKAAVRAALPENVEELLRAEGDRAVELVAGDEFVNVLGQEPSARHRAGRRT